MLYLFFAILLRLIAVVTTYLIVDKFGLEKEMNPVARFVFAKMGLLYGMMLMFFASLPVIWYAQASVTMMVIVLVVFGLDALNDVFVFYKKFGLGNNLAP
jgi:uncharacterized protein YacL